jgi:NADH-quinone oxidoreductase subunit E
VVLKPHGIEIDIHTGMVAFSSSALSECQRLFERYPNRRSALLPVLWLAQREFHVITPEVTDYIGELLGLPGSDVYSVASFYTMFNKRPVGKYHLQVCHNVTCYLRGCRNVITHIKKRLGIESGQTTSDGKFTLSTVECLGSCDSAPMMQVNERYYENLTLERVDQILTELSKDERIQRDPPATAQHRGAEPGPA